MLCLTGLPDGVDARRFDVAGGASLIAIDNPRQVAGAKLVFRGAQYDIPADRLAIIEAAR